MSILKNILISLFIIISPLIAEQWIKDGNNFISSKKLVLQFNDAPQIPNDSPLKLNDKLKIKRIANQYGESILKPTFTTFTTFNENHYKHNLHEYYNLEFSGSVDIRALKKELESIIDLKRIEFDFRVSINLIPNDPTYSSQWALNNSGQASQDGGGNVGNIGCDIDSEQAWDVTTGSEDIIIAILDTGVNNHSEFNGRLLEGYDFIDNDSNPTDGNGHGTACAGISAAEGNNGVGIAGICWDCMILPVKIMSDDGFGEDTQIADGVIWASDFGADIISMSLGGGGNVSYFDNAINYAVDNGTIVFAASGNDDASSISYPSAYENCISIGALSPCDERKTYGSCDGENFWGSNYGQGLEFLAPGVRIHTTSYTGGYTSTFNGTSSACPHAAGIAGLLLSADQALSVEGLLTIMRLSAVDIGIDGYDIETGYGRLSAFNALATIVGGPELNLSSSSINEELEINQSSQQVITLSNTGQMDLNISIDPFGYYWKDNYEQSIDYNWIDISENYTTLTFPHNDEAAIEIVNIPFPFYFYQNNYTSLIVNANGWVGFNQDNNAWENLGLPNISAPQNAIFAFWDDLNPVNSANSNAMDGYVRYQSTEERVVIWYDNVRRWTGSSEMDGYYDFQIVLYVDGTIDLNYRTMSGNIDSATIGIQNEDGNQGLNISINQNFVQDSKTLRIKGTPKWLSILPLDLQIENNTSEQIYLNFDSTELATGSYEYLLNLATNDFNLPNVEVPISLEVSDNPCTGSQIGDLNFDNQINVLDIIFIVNIILYNTEDECAIYVADVNMDYNINILDVVAVINLILDE